MRITIKRKHSVVSYSTQLSSLPDYSSMKFSDLSVTEDNRTLASENLDVLITIQSNVIVISEFTSNMVYVVRYDTPRQRNNIFRKIHNQLFGV